MVKSLQLVKDRIKRRILSSHNKQRLFQKGAALKDTQSQQTKLQQHDSSTKGNCIQENYYTFQTTPDLFALLYCTVIFKWIQTDRVRDNT